MNADRFVNVKRRRSHRYMAAAVVILGMVGLSACQTAQQKVSEREDDLAAAGFLVKPANTPARKAMLSRLPANHFVRRVTGDDVHYVYADPLVCGCLYVGSQQAYGAYKQHQQQEHLANEQQMIADSYSDANWNWGDWGPWGGVYRFDYGGGMGWSR